MSHVERLVDFGPRVPGSPALEQARGYIIRQLESFGWKSTRQEFTDRTPRGDVVFVNIVAEFPGKPTGRASNSSFLLCSHYDTKTFDTIRFVGANDGGSGTGTLLEMARILAAQPDLARRLQLVFFDGEEAYESFSETDGLYGSRHFAKQLSERNGAGKFRGGILFDMIGDRSLTVTLPPDSPAALTKGVFAAADALGARAHFSYSPGAITDDHTPLNAAGIPTIDLIDFDYPPWHTAEDTIDKLSAASLQTVGAVTAYYLSQIALK
ncbi:MAG: M28 family metallopeptidase [Chthoniobacterales bacterium]